MPSNIAVRSSKTSAHAPLLRGLCRETSHFPTCTAETQPTSKVFFSAAKPSDQGEESVVVAAAAAAAVDHFSVSHVQFFGV